MFTLSEIEIIMEKHRNDMLALLRELGFRASTQNWLEEIDPFITDKVCTLMKSDSVVEGYSFMLRAADIPQNYSETPNEKLAKIIANRNEIEQSIIMKNALSAGVQHENRFKVMSVKNINLDNLVSIFNELYELAEDSGYMLKRFGMSMAQKEFRLSVKKLGSEIQKLQESQESLYTSSELLKSCTGSELESFIEKEKQNVNNMFLVSVSREKVTPKPDPSLQFRKFTEDEARYMLDILEKINAVISSI
ncbi:MAG: hypothetical protein IJP48_09025 [Synergistaceae bacterium]|nr:hypothetical protein [Synergistaceae bacterium]